MVEKGLTSSFFKANRDKLLANLKADCLVITASGLMQKSADQSFPFRQDSNFFYLTGINEADLILVKTKKEEFLIVPDNYMAKINFAVSTDNVQIAKTSGIKEVLNQRTGWQRLVSIVSGQTTLAVAMPSPIRLKHYSMYVNPARRKLYLKLKRKFKSTTFIDARTELARQRMIKQPIEIKLIEKATDITVDTLKEVLASSNLSRYTHTEEIAEDILNGFKAKGGSGHAFDPVVAAGRNAATIHYESFEKLRPGELILADVGSEYSFYCSDISRTVSFGKSTPRQKAVYDAVYEVQSEVFKMIKPGLDFKTYEQHVTSLIGQKLKELELIDSPSSKEIRKFYPHACSHSVGLDPHDSADYSKPMAENMVITVEPGIYIKNENIGVRLEDVVLITKDGAKVLSSRLPTSLSF